MELLLESRYMSGMLLSNVRQLKAGQIFYNAWGTSGDKINVVDVITVNGNRQERVAIDFWVEATGQNLTDIHHLCSNANCPHGNNPHLTFGDEIIVPKYKLEGAHIVFTQPTQNIQPGEKFCIIPLCPSCNHYTNTSLMILRHDIRVPILTWEGLSVRE